MYNNELLKLLVEQIPSGVIITDARGNLLLSSRLIQDMWEQCNLPSTLEKYMSGSRNMTFEMYHMDDTPYQKHEIPLARVIMNLEYVKNEHLKMKSRDGWIYAIVSASPVFIENRFEYVIFTCENVTDKIKAQEDIVSANIASRFLATMSHEIRTPVHGILGMLDVFSESPMSADQEQHVQVIQRSTKNLLVILNDILDYSKGKAEKVEFDNRVYNIRQIFSDINIAFGSVVAHSKVNLGIFVEPDVPDFNFGDPQRLTQCLNNIVSNAVKFVKPNTSTNVFVTVSRSAHRLKIVIADSGIGMTKETLSKLFVPFMQADSSITRNYGGTGLGLAIVKQIIEQMEGEVFVTSELNVGSQFTLSIPLVQALPGKVVDQSISIPNNQFLSPLPSPPLEEESYVGRILLAEDNPVNKYITTTLLSKRNFKVSAVEDGTEVLDLLEKDPYFDLLLLDIQMPKLGGHETCRQLRARGWNKPIIALTASAMESDKMKCLSVGMDDYMSKPFDVKVLMQKIQYWLSKAL